MSPRAKKLSIALFILLIVVAIGAVLSARFVIQPFVRAKVQALVRDHLHAKLAVGSFTYRFPYGVTIRDAVFTAEDSPESGGAARLVSIQRLDLSLAQLPLRPGPVIIEHIAVVNPVVHLVRAPDGALVEKDLLKHDDTAQPSQSQMKLSDVLRLRQLDITGATVIYEDQSHPDAKPMEWRDISAHLSLAPTSASNYSIHFLADNSPLATLDVSASADVDALTARIEQLTMNVDVRAADASSPLPAKIQEIFNRFGIEGAVRINGGGEVAYHNLSAAPFHVDVHLEHARARVPATDQGKSPLTLDDLRGTFRAERAAGKEQIELHLADLRAIAAGAALRCDGIAGEFNTAKHTWKAGPIAASVAAHNPQAGALFEGGTIEIAGNASGALPRNQSHESHAQIVAKLDKLVVQPRQFPQPLREVTGVLRITDQTLLVQNILAKYGPDRISINQAVVGLAGVGSRLEAKNIIGTIAIAPSSDASAQYPHPLDKLVEALNPVGTFAVQGAAAVVHRRGQLDPDFAISILPMKATATIADFNTKLTDLTGEIAIAPKLVTLRSLSGTMCNGTFSAIGMFSPRTPASFTCEFRTQGIDLAQLSRNLKFFKDNGKPMLTGRAASHVALAGQIPVDAASRPVDTLRGHGWVRVSDGDFWSLKILDGVEKSVPVARDALTAGEVAAAFDISDQRVYLRRAAINSPALGLQGSGDVGFDGSVNLDFIAAPLGDWRKKIKSTGIPIISDVAGNVVGAIQKLVNTATSNLLYEFRVTGTKSDYTVKAVPAPILTENAADLFGMMLRNTGADKLFDSITGSDTKDDPATTQPAESSDDDK